MRFLKICIFCIVFLALGITLVNVADLQKTNTNLNNQITQQEQTYSGKIDELTVYQEKLVERISLLEENYQKLQIAYDELKAAYDQYILDSTLEREQIQVTVVDLRETIAVLENNADVDAETITALESEVTALETSLENQTTTANELQATVTQQEATIEELNETIETLISELNSDNQLFNKLVDGSITTISAEDLDGVTSIRPYAFAYCNTLLSVELSEDVSKIDTYAFAYCENLTTVEMTDSVAEFGEYAFRNSGLTSVVVPDSVKTIPTYCFGFCTNLSNIQLSDSLETIGVGAFYETGLTSVIIPRNVISLGDNVFDGCTNLTNVEFETDANCETLGRCLFSGCVNLIEFTVPAKVTFIGDTMFMDVFDRDIPVIFEAGGTWEFGKNNILTGWKPYSSASQLVLQPGESTLKLNRSNSPAYTYALKKIA